MSRVVSEYRVKGSLFDIPREHFSTAASGEPLLGPAAGPHTQLAQNILCAWLCGARYFELKTVQKLDALEIGKPCIDARDEGYNSEWSTELTLDQAYEEYVKAWFLLHLFEGPLIGKPTAGGIAGSSFLFNMSVGYDLEGIKTEKMDRFINRLIDSSGEPAFLRLLKETAELVAGHPFDGESRGPLPDAPPSVSPLICRSVTLSTMHGCPPAEVESICVYLMEEKGLDTLVKLNPTLMGYAKTREMLDILGYGYVELSEEGFDRDLRYADAIPMLQRLLALAKRKGRRFGVKLSNTLAAANTRGVLPGKEMYMSGRSLYPITISLAAMLAAEFHGELPISFCGGVSAGNLREILNAGIRPVTLATELLKPGGYGRLKQLAGIAEEYGKPIPGRTGAYDGHVSPDKVRLAAESALASPLYRKAYRGVGRAGVRGRLPLFDCFIAPCVQACPIAQDVPEYIHLAGAGRYMEALALIHEKNPLPFITGYLCDHQCMESCSRLDWEGTVKIREMKRISAERGYASYRESGGHTARRAAPRNVKTAVLGAGPAGLAASSFLAREGFEAHVFEREKEPGGVVRYLLPGFRVPPDAVENDVSLLRDLGVRFHFGLTETLSIEELKKEGFRYVLAAVGTEAGRGAGFEDAWDALDFLRRFREGSALRLGRVVAVIGAGDTAMDAARAARRCPGVKEVRIIYRRSETEMPASREEYDSARDEGIQFHFLRDPERRGPAGALVCRVMGLGSPDGSGRKRPISTDLTEVIPADAVIAATGASVDSENLRRIGLSGGDVRADPQTQETPVHGVFLIGDAASGAQTIVKAIASAGRAVKTICLREGGNRLEGIGVERPDAHAVRGRRDRLMPGSLPGMTDEKIGERESFRCLACNILCMKCVEVCPNRANTIVRVAEGFKDGFQILHLDALCNECGNCATFCPWEGRPYRDKLTLYAGEGDFNAGENPGFFLNGGKGRLRVGERTLDVGAVESSNIGMTVEETKAWALMRAVEADHRYLLPGADGSEGGTG